MRPELRFIGLLALTYAVYGFTILYSTGGIIFPFPLNEAAFLCGVLYFMYLHPKPLPLIDTILYILIAVTGILAKELSYSFFYDQQEMMRMSESIVTDIFQIIQYLLLLTMMISLIMRDYRKTAFKMVLAYPAVILFVALVILEQEIVLFIPYGLFTFFLIKNMKNKGLHHAWLLLFVLQGFFAASLLLNIF